MNREQMLRFIAIVAKLFPKLNNHLVQRAGGAEIIVAPDLVEQPISLQHFTRVRVEKLEQPYFLGRQFLIGLAPLNLKGLGVNCG